MGVCGCFDWCCGSLLVALDPAAVVVEFELVTELLLLLLLLLLFARLILVDLVSIVAVVIV